jgi:hypothetical protein
MGERRRRIEMDKRFIVRIQSSGYIGRGENYLPVKMKTWGFTITPRTGPGFEIIKCGYKLKSSASRAAGNILLSFNGIRATYTELTE